MAELENATYHLNNNISNLKKLRREFEEACQSKVNQREANDLDADFRHYLGDFCSIKDNQKKSINEDMKMKIPDLEDIYDGIKFVNNKSKHERLTIVLTDNPFQGFKLDNSKLDSRDVLGEGTVKWHETLLNSDNQKQNNKKKNKQKFSFNHYFSNQSVFFFIDKLISLDEAYLNLIERMNS